MITVLGLDGDESLPVTAASAPGGNKLAQVRQLVSNGQRFLVYPNGVFSFDITNGFTVDWTKAITLTSDNTAMEAAIDLMLEAPPMDAIQPL